MDKLLSDSAKTEISNKDMDTLRAYHISNWHSEPYHQNQNPAEWRYRTIKSWTNTVMNRSGAPANCWLLFTSLDGKNTFISLNWYNTRHFHHLTFHFLPTYVLCHTYDKNFPSEIEERAGYWVGFGEHCGDAMTHKILDHDTQKIIYRSAARPKKSSTPNHRLAPHGGEVSASSDPSEDKISSGPPLGYPEGSSPEQKAPTVFIRSRDEENPSGSKTMPTFDPSDLIGRTFLLPPEENGERHRAKVTRQVVKIIDQDNGQRVENINFILNNGNGKVEELISYNQLLEHIENVQDHDIGMDQELNRFRAVIGHQDPLLASEPDWKGSKYNVQVEWETGEITFEPLSIIAADTIYIKTQVFRLLRYYSPSPRNIDRSDWATQNITHNMTSSIIQPHGLHSPKLCFTKKGILVMPYISLMTRKNSKESLTTIFCTVIFYLYISFNRQLWMSR